MIEPEELCKRVYEMLQNSNISKKEIIDLMKPNIELYKEYNII